MLYVSLVCGCSTAKHDSDSPAVPGDPKAHYEPLPPNKVKITGQVYEPGLYDFHEGQTLNDVMAEAGGVTDFTRKIIILHKDGTEQRFHLKRTGTTNTDVTEYRLEHDSWKDDPTPIDLKKVFLRDGDWVRFVRTEL